jgi:hypothetical protein
MLMCCTKGGWMPSTTSQEPIDGIARDLLSGLIQQQNELGELGKILILHLLSAGIQPHFRNAKDYRFQLAPSREQ